MVSPLPMETHLSRLWVFATFQNFAENSLDSWMETSEMTNEPLVPLSLCLSFTLSSLLPLHLLCASASFFYLFPPTSSPLKSPVPFFPLTTPLVRSATVTGTWATISNLSNPLYLPLTPCCHLLSLRLCSLCPSTAFGSLLSAETQFPASLWPGVKLPLLISSPFLWASTLLSPCFSVTFLFLFPSPPNAAEALQLHHQFSPLRLALSWRSDWKWLNVT